jgi:hypothetical protein
MLPLAFIFYGALAAFMSNLFIDEDGGRNVIVRRRAVG